MSVAGSKIREYAKSLQNRTKTAFYKLGEVGAYNLAMVDGYTYGGEIHVDVIPRDDGASLIASGKGVCFIEFGAGYGTDPSHPYAGEMDFTVAPGSYSSTIGSGEFASQGYWMFNDRIMTNVPARRGMYNASALMKKKTADIMKEEFSSDRY